MLKPEGKRSLERPESRWEDNIRMDIAEIIGEGVDYKLPKTDSTPWN
jgi:hypothetical protein